MSQEVALKLRKLSKAWSRSEARVAGSPIKDGDYIGKVVKMEVGESKKGRLQVATRFKIMDGKVKGQETSRFDGIETEENMDWFKGLCEVLGVDIPDDLEELPEA